MTVNFDSVKLGVCEIKFKAFGATSFIDLGLTSGGCEWKYAPKWKELIADQYGETPIDYVLVGEAVSVKVPLIETSKDKMKLAMSGATLSGSGTTQKLNIGSKPGKRASESAGVLVLHPISSGASYEDDITIYKAFNNGETVLPFTIEKEQVMECMFVGLIDPNRTNGSMLCGIGENTLNTAPKVITAFDFDALTPDVLGSISEYSHMINLSVPTGTNVTALVPTIMISGTSVAPASGIAQNFTNPVTYTVTASDGTTQPYVVTVTVQ